MSLFGIFKDQASPPGEWELKKMRIPVEFWEASLEEIPSEAPHLKTVREWLLHLQENVQKGRGLVFYGPMQSGKTSLCAIIAKELSRWWGETFFVRYVSLKQLFEGVDHEVRAKAMRRILKSDLLIVDDVLDINPSEYTLTNLGLVVRERKENRRSTLFTANVSSGEVHTLFKKAFGTASWYLIRASCDFVEVSCTKWVDKALEEGNGTVDYSPKS